MKMMKKVKNIDKNMAINTIKDFNFKNKRVLLRVDFNVPMDESGKIEDDFRIQQTLPTIKYLLKKQARPVLCSHRSDGKSLAPAWKQLEKYMDIDRLVFLENLRLEKGEESNSASFAKKLSSLADVYINDAFGVCHRKHASVVGVPKYLPSGMGLLLEKEVKALSKVLENPKRPLVAIIGGAKIESKSAVIDNFLKVADSILIGGKIGFQLKKKSAKLHLPSDYINDYDIGSETIKEFKKIIAGAGTVVWAGPMGWFEKKGYEKGTREIAKAIIKSKAFSVVGGGDTLSALEKFKLRDKFDHVSTGGGAMLSFLAGDKLPGLESLWK